MKKIKIVLIEDNQIIVEMIKECLQDESGIEIIGIAYNGEEGLRLIKSLQPDVVLLDLIMAEMDGFEVLSRANNNFLFTKFLVLSSLNDDYFIKKALSLGASYYLVKPFNNNVLIERIKDLAMFESRNIKQEINEINIIKESNKENKKVEVVNDENNALRERISDILLSIGIPANIIGFEVLKEAIVVAIEKPDLIFSVTKGLYPEVANRLNNTVSGVERAIRHAIDTSWNKGRMDSINALLGVHAFSTNEKPTNSEFIAMLSRKMTVKNT